VLAAVLLMTWYVAGALAGSLITGLAGVMLTFLWFAVPLASRREGR
jgi:hypothetical protein